MLFFFDIISKFEKTRGLIDHNFSIENISIFSNKPQPKGLFVPIHDTKLNVAIQNGAIATLWKEDKELPSYTPNHFPVIFVHDPLKALQQICDEYIKTNKKNESETMTKIAFYEPKLLNEDPFTYDIAGEDNQNQLMKTINNFIECQRRG